MAIATTDIFAQLAAVDTRQDPLKDIGPLGEGIWLGILGPKRTGKGLISTNLALQAALAGVDVYHFGNLRFGKKIDDVLTLLEHNPEMFRNCLFVFDEVDAHMLRSKSATTVSILLDNVMTQSGHFNISAIWTTTDQRGVHPAFIDHTHLVYWLDQFGWRKEPLFDNRPPGMGLTEGWQQKLTNKCEGWYEPEIDGPDFSRLESVPYHQGPPGMIDCRTALVAVNGRMVPGKHTIRYLLTSQAPSRWGAAGLQETGQLNCAHRLYKLNETDAFISNMAIATTTAGDVRDAARVNQVAVVAAAVRQMAAAGKNGVFPFEISEYIRGQLGQDVAESRVGQILALDLGVMTVKKSAGGRPNRRSGYAIQDWAAAHPE